MFTERNNDRQARRENRKRCAHVSGQASTAGEIQPRREVEDRIAGALYASGLASQVQSLREVGVGVVIIQNVPVPEGVYNQQTLLRKVIPPPVPEGFNREAARQLGMGGRAAESAVSEPDSGVVLVDSFEVLCPSTGADCPLALDGVPLYNDPAHISAEGTELMTDDLVSAVAKLGLQ